jgi:hypothetical protein
VPASTALGGIGQSPAGRVEDNLSNPIPGGSAASVEDDDPAVVSFGRKSQVFAVGAEGYGFEANSSKWLALDAINNQALLTSGFDNADLTAAVGAMAVPKYVLSTCYEQGRTGDEQ